MVAEKEYLSSHQLLVGILNEFWDWLSIHIQLTAFAVRFVPTVSFQSKYMLGAGTVVIN
jgi:hypothetical protein